MNNFKVIRLVKKVKCETMHKARQCKLLKGGEKSPEVRGHSAHDCRDEDNKDNTAKRAHKNFGSAWKFGRPYRINRENTHNAHSYT